MRAALATALCSLLSLTALDVSAQTPQASDDAPTRHAAPAAEEEPFGRAQRERFYEQGKRSHAKALGYTFLLPGLGNIYADQPFTGALLMSTLALTLVTLTYGAFNNDAQLVTIGAIATGGIYATGAITSYYGVSEHNRTLRIRYNLTQQPAIYVPVFAWEF